MERNLKFFMRDKTNEVVTVPGPNSFKDDEGKVIDLEIKVLSQSEIQHIHDNYRRRSIAMDKRGNPLAANGEVLWKTEKDNQKAADHIIAEALQYPNLKDPELMEFYNCADITEMPALVFSRPDEYSHVVRAVMAALGITEDESEDEKAKEIKN